MSKPGIGKCNGQTLRSVHGLDFAPCPTAALDKAKDNINKYFSFIGVVEQYSESLKIMATMFGLARLEEHLANKTRPNSEGMTLPPDIISKIRSQNLLDLALYEWIKHDI